MMIDNKTLGILVKARRSAERRAAEALALAQELDALITAAEEAEAGENGR
jgi:hypothetical protein